MLNNGTNSTSSDDELATSLQSIGLFVLSIIFDGMFLRTTLACKNDIVRTEYFILMTISCLSMSIKLIGIYKNLEFICDMSFMGFFNCLLNYSIDIDIGFVYFMIYVYYSLFHLSTIDRSCFFRLIYGIFHEKPNNFLIYLTTVFVVFTIFISVFTTVFRSQIFQFSSVSGQCFISEGSKIVFIPILFYTLCIFAQIVYLIGMGVSLVLIVNRRSKTKHEIKNIRRSLIVSVKFFLFSITSLWITMPQYIFFVLVYFIPKWNYSDLFKNYINLVSGVQLVSEFLLITQTLFLVLINVRLRHQFKRLYLLPVFCVIRDQCKRFQCQQQTYN